ncbi:FAST kinase domain-containing protein 5, mitochondrial [Schistocerca serialis cubense]|uniref:FAST kinase domain-containing protein 5, mitochondrial n=1 Tax=Schistocerca serialis cubense TaxID=2023355 RepID=UPI00214E2BEC|nr:FAST kinase domain-containing protein 5, mitochondrial [Schistocerca serialis cubense]
MKTLLKFSTFTYKCLNRSACDKLCNFYTASRYFASHYNTLREPCLSRICYRLPVLHKQICTTAAVNVKLFAEGENAYAHTVFERLPVYSQTLAPAVIEVKHVSEENFQEIVKTDWSDGKVDDVYAAFETVSHYVASHPHEISDELFSNLCAAVADKSEKMSDENLFGMLRCLRLWPMAKSVETPNFAKIWRSVDKECVKRIKTWDLNTVLYVCDHWYKLYLVRKSDFMWFANFKLGKKPTRLLPYQLIQCMFYTNVYRRWHPECIKYEFEYSVEKCFDELSLDEIGVFAMGFFKSQTKIRSHVLISEILARTTNELDNVHDITLAAILKIIRYSLTPHHADILYYCLEKLKDQVPRLSLLSLVHVALAGTNVQLFHKDLMRTISQRFCDEVKTARLKDLERFALALTQYDYDPQTTPCIYKIIAEELHSPSRRREIELYPKCLACCLYYLSLRDTYHLDLIDSVLQHEFIKNTYGKNEFAYGRELLCLDVGVELECPDYNGNRLSQKTRSRITKSNTKWTPSRGKRSHSQTDKFMLEVMDSLEEILGGPHNLHAVHILPQYERADIVFGIDNNGKPSNIPAQFKELPLHLVKPPPTNEDQTLWYAVVIGGWNLFIRGEDRPVGAIVTKIRQLKRLGYKPTLVSWFNWSMMKSEQKKEFLKNMTAGKQLVRSIGQV